MALGCEDPRLFLRDPQGSRKYLGRAPPFPTPGLFDDNVPNICILTVATPANLEGHFT